MTWNDDRLPAPDRPGGRRAPRRLGVLVRSTPPARARPCSRPRPSSRCSTRSWPHAIDRSADHGRQRAPGHGGRARPGAPLAGAHASCTSRSPTSPATRTAGCRRPTSTRCTRPTRSSAGSLDTVTKTAELRDHTLVVLTADHGGKGAGHADPGCYADYRVPFLVWGPGVAAGTDLYDAQPDVRRPRHAPAGLRRRPSRSATATSATWSSTCSACRRSPAASSTPTRTSRSSTSLRPRGLRTEGASGDSPPATLRRLPEPAAGATGCGGSRRGPWTAASSPAPAVPALSSRGGRGRASGRSRG